MTPYNPPRRRVFGWLKRVDKALKYDIIYCSAMILAESKEDIGR